MRSQIPPRSRRVVAAAAAVLALAVAAPAASAAPERIVALTPFSANTLAGLGIEPVGIGQTLGGKERYSRGLKGAETLLLSHPNGPNLEELAVLDPDLVFSSPTWRKGSQTMRDLEIDVAEADPGNVRQAYRQTRRIGRIVGEPRKARVLAKRLAKRVKRVRRNIRKRPRVLLVLGVGRTPFVFLPNSWGGDIMRKAGARLVTGGVSHRSGFVRIADEKILKANPDIIVAVPHANEDDIPGVVDHLKSNPAWEGTKAVRRNRLYVSTDNSLLQAGTDIPRVIRTVRKRYLDNWR